VLGLLGELNRVIFKVLLVLVIILILGMIPTFAGPAILRLLILTYMTLIMCISWNIVSGYTRFLSLGHSVFLGIGAYTSAILYTKYGISPWIGMVISLIPSALLAFVIGILTFRLHGAFFALTTIAILQILMLLALHFVDITRGALGIIYLPKNDPFNFFFLDIAVYYYIIYVMLLVALYISYSIDRGFLGRSLKAIGDDEVAAAAIGINTMRTKILAFIISAVIATPVGTFYAQYIGYITPESVFSLGFSIRIAVIGMIGGAGTFLGPILGTLILVPADQLLTIYLSSYYGLNLVVYGFLLMAIMLFLPKGVIGIIEGFTKWQRRY
jgi:branched-chain amino acid transport system permease protein